MEDGQHSVSSSIEHPNDVDVWRLHLAAGQTLTVDTDTIYFPETGQGFGPDTVLALFDRKGTLVAVDDDTPGQPVGQPLDSLITYEVTEGGIYYIAVSSYANLPTGEGGFVRGPDYTDTGRTAGDYDLNILIA